MGINVACAAGVESQSFELHGLAGCLRFVAFFTGDLGVHPRKRIARLRMIKLRSLAPVAGVVALFASAAKLPLMRIGVASQTLLGQPEKRSGEIPDFDERTLGRNDARSRMAVSTSNASVLAIQVVTRQSVIELFLGWRPLNEVIFFAVVFEMATNAFLTFWIAHLDLCVESVFCRKAFGDFFVAI